MILDQLFEDNSKKKLNEVDPRNFDSDEDYYAAVRGNKRGSDDDYDYEPEDEIADMDDDESYYEKYVRTKNLEEENLDEISLDQIGRGVGKVLGGVGKTVGAVAGVPQGIGRAIKKGYQGSVQGIGGQSTDSTPRLGSKEVPTATGMINPATGRAYVPSDFGDEEAAGAEQGARTPATVQQDIKNLDTQYRAQMRKLQSELQQVQSQPQAGDDFTQAQKDYMAAIGPDVPEKNTVPAIASAEPTDFAARRSDKQAAAKANIDATAAPAPTKTKTSQLTPQQQIEKRRVDKQQAAIKALTPTTTPTWTGRPATSAPEIAESLTWSKNWDPSESLLRKLH